MSRAIQPNYPSSRLPLNLSAERPVQLPQRYRPQLEQRQDQQQRDRHQQSRNSHSLANSRHSPRRLSSPLDFTDSIPFNELELSNETLGSGSFGTVFKGRWRSYDVAVKQYRTTEEIESFSVEVKQLSRVKHKNIVKLYGASRLSKAAAYLIMEYAEGGSLNHLLHGCRQQEYDLRHACSWAMQAAQGVAYLHSLRPKPIMHRDLKPANLLLFSRGKILKICDFGTACAVRTKMTSNTGSAPYMAPEVFSTESYLESGDVFSWSIIFWEILVRMQPYYKQLSHPFQILWQVNRGTRPREIDNCPEVIWDLITQSWDRDPKKRPSMKEVASKMEFIFSLAATSDNSVEPETKSLPRSPEEALTPTNPAADDIPHPSGQKRDVHQRCKAFVDRFILGAGHGDRSGGPSTSAQSQTNLSAERPITNSTTPSLADADSVAQEAIDYRPTSNHQKSPPKARLMSSQVIISQDQHKIHQYEQVRHQTNQWSTTNSHRSLLITTNRLKALMLHIELLQKRYDEIQNELRCDKRNNTAESFEEFTELKSDIEQLKQLIKKGAAVQALSPFETDGSSNQPYPTPPPTNHKPLRSQGTNQEVHSYENTPAPQLLNDALK